MRRRDCAASKAVTLETSLDTSLSLSLHASHWLSSNNTCLCLEEITVLPGTQTKLLYKKNLLASFPAESCMFYRDGTKPTLKNPVKFQFMSCTTKQALTSRSVGWSVKQAKWTIGQNVSAASIISLGKTWLHSPKWHYFLKRHCFRIPSSTGAYFKLSAILNGPEMKLYSSVKKTRVITLITIRILITHLTSWITHCSITQLLSFILSVWSKKDHLDWQHHIAHHRFIIMTGNDEE